MLIAEAGATLVTVAKDVKIKGQSTWATAQDLARRYRGDDPDRYRAEFVRSSSSPPPSIRRT